MDLSVKFDADKIRCAGFNPHDCIWCGLKPAHRAHQQKERLNKDKPYRAALAILLSVCGL